MGADSRTQHFYPQNCSDSATAKAAGFGQDGERPLNYDSELFDTEYVFVERLARNVTLLYIVRAIVFILAVVLGLVASLFFETLVMLNFNFVELHKIVSIFGVRGLFGSQTPDPSLPIAVITGAFAGYLIYLRLLPVLEEKIRFGKLKPEPSESLQGLEPRINTLIDQTGLYDPSHIEWIFDQRLKTAKEPLVYSPLNYLYQASVAGAASFYEQLLVADPVPEYPQAVERLTAWVNELEDLAQPVEDIAKRQVQEATNRRAEALESVYRAIDADKATERLLILGF